MGKTESHTVIIQTDKFKEVAFAFYIGKHWHVEKTPTSEKIILVEVWKNGNEIEYHPSRNRFYPTSNLEHKKALHDLVTTPNILNLSDSGNQSKNRRLPTLPEYPLLRNPTTEYRHPALGLRKSKSFPDWAMKNKVIGYTCSTEIHDFTNFTILGQPLYNITSESIPSIYYENGHVTVDHLTPGNIGWANGRGWERLFFGNVLSRDYERIHKSKHK